jgi:predicted Zn-dependent peptidase
VVTVAGGIEHARVLEAVRPYARRLAVGHRQGYVPVRPVAGPRVALETRTTEQTQLALGFRTCSRHDPRRYPLRVLNALLGENMSSRLFQLVREQRGLTYNIYSAPSHFEDTGDLVITAGLDADELETTLRLVLRVLRQLGDQVVSRGELRRAKDYIIGQFDLGMESTETQMNWVGEQLLGHGEVQLPARVRAEIQAVTAAQVRATARDFFQPDRLAMALVSPLRRVRPWHKLVSSWTGP